MAPFDCHLTELDDARLADLAREWRMRALRGEQIAYGIAQVLEAEERRRDRTSHRQQASQTHAAASAPWWQFWKAREQRLAGMGDVGGLATAQGRR